MFGLRITRRCWLDDLGYTEPTTDLATALEHLIVRDFVNTRRQNPDGHEGPLAALGVPHMRLKAGRWRGVTIWEAHPQGRAGIQDPALAFPGVVWLAGVGYRKEGDPDDAYKDFERFGAAGLAPKVEDYEDLYAAIRLAAFEALRDDLERALNELVEEAEREPGVLHRAEVEIAEIAFGVVILDTLEYRVLVLPILDWKRRPIPEAVHEVLIEIAFPDCRLDELEYPDPAMLARLGYEPSPYDLALACLRERRSGRRS